MQKMHRFFISKNKIKNALKNKKAAPDGQPFFCKKVKLPIDFFTDIWYYDYTNIRSFRLFKLED